MTWIVGWWHLISYTKDGGLIYRFAGDESITMLMLGLFMFISGLCIGGKSFNEAKDVWSFYKTRFWRFYVLYAISATTMPLLTILNRSIPLWFTTVTVTSTFILPQPYTLWFMSMLAVFYILTPLLKRNYLLVGGGFYILVICIHLLLPRGIDTRFFLYYPLYVFGLFVSTTDWLEKIINNMAIKIVLFIVSVLSFFLARHYEFFSYFFVFGGIFSLLSVCKTIETSVHKGIINYISYSSLSTYLFHRQFYSIIDNIIGNHLIVLILVAFPLCICLSWIIQKTYDHLLQKAIYSQKCS